MTRPLSDAGARPEIVVRTYKEGCAALDCMLHAVRYLAKQFSVDMSRESAVINMESRKLLMVACFGLLDEMEEDLERAKVVH